MTNISHIPDHSPAAISEGIDAALIRAAFAKLEAKEMRQYREEIKTTARPQPDHSDTMRSLRRKMRARRTQKFLTHHLPRAAQLAACLIGILAIGTGVAFAASPAARQWAAGVLVGSERKIDENDAFAGWLDDGPSGFMGGTIVDGAAYLADVNNQTIRRIDDSNTEPTLYQPEAESDGYIYSVTQSGGEVYAIYSDTDGFSLSDRACFTRVCRVEFGENTYHAEALAQIDARVVSKAACLGGKLYIVLSDDGSTEKNFVAVCDLTNGSVERLPCPLIDNDEMFNVAHLFSGPENRIYVVRQNQTDDFDGSIVFRLEDDGSWTQVAELPAEGYNYAFGFAYRPADDSVIYIQNNAIYRAPGGDYASAERVGITSEESGTGLIVGENGYMLVNGAHAQVFDLNTDISGAIELTVGGNAVAQPKHIEAMMTAHENLTVRDVTNFETLPEFREGVDIWMLDDEALRTFIAADYGAEITNETVLDTITGMFPGTQAMLKSNGRTIAVPEHQYYNLDVSYNVQLWEDLGVSKEDLPDSWPELLALLGDLSRSGSAAKHLIIPPIADEDAKTFFIRWLYLAIVDSYARTWNAQGWEIDFSDARFQTLMELYAQIDFDAFRYETTDAKSIYGPALIDVQPTASFPYYSEEDTRIECALCVTDDLPSYSRAYGSYAVIDPNTAHPELAQEYLQTVVDSYDEWMRGYLLCEPAEPEYQDPEAYRASVGDTARYSIYNLDTHIREELCAAGTDYLKGEIDFSEYAALMNDITNSC